MIHTPHPIPYELRIGVIGHRKLDNPDLVTKHVESLFGQLEDILKPSEVAPLKWAVISPLARGSDRLVAQVAVDKEDTHLEVILPYEEKKYRDRMEPEDEPVEFDRLLDEATKITSLTAKAPDDPETTSWYLDVGQALVDSSEMLVAIWRWDGSSPIGDDYTGKIIDYVLDSNRVVLWIHPDQLSEPVRMLVRQQIDGPIGYCKLPKAAEDLSLGYHQLYSYMNEQDLELAEYNKAFATEKRYLEKAAQEDSKSPPSSRISRLWQSILGIIPRSGRADKEAAQEDGDPAELERISRLIQPILDHILPRFVRADKLTLKYQNGHINSSRALYYLAAFTVTVGAVQLILLPEYMILGIVEILVLAGVNLWAFISIKRGWHEKWLQDRYISEQLRIATYTMLLNEPPQKTAAGHPETLPKTLPFYAGPKDWLPSTVRQIIDQVPTQPIEEQDLCLIKKFIIKGWLKGQRKYHVDNTIKKKKAHAIRQRIVLVLFFATFVLTCLDVFNVANWTSPSNIKNPNQWFQFLSIVLPAWGAAVLAISKQMEYERIASRSAEMVRVLSPLIKRAEQSTTVPELRVVVQEAAQVMALENYEWCILLSFDPPELAA